MAHQLSNRHEVHPAAHELGPEGVPEHVGPKWVGTIGLEPGEPPQAGRGATFFVSLPVVDADPARESLPVWGP